MIRKGHRPVKAKSGNTRYRALPDDILANADKVETPVMFMTGEINRVFTDSNIHCHQALEKQAPGRHELVLFPGYGHQDVFMGKQVDVDIFPRLLTFLEKHRAEPPDTIPFAQKAEHVSGV